MPELSVLRRSPAIVLITFSIVACYVMGAMWLNDVLFHQTYIPTPVRLQIASINLDAPIAEVGLASDGLMDIPPTAQELGWFEPGYIPGEQGNAVIAGHLDTASGKPAAFWALNQLEAGDVIVVLYDDGSQRSFEVMRQQTYSSDNAPLDAIFGSSTGAYLNLITCKGIWDVEDEAYEERLVVYSRLK